MSVEFSLSVGNEHYNQSTPQGYMLGSILELTGNCPNVWYCDTFSFPAFIDLKRYYQGMGTIIMYCWWDPADDRLHHLLDELDLDFIIITSDPDFFGPRHPRVKTIKWNYQYGYHMELIKNNGMSIDCDTRQFLCMMRNHKPERLNFLSELWYQGKLDEGYVSYLGQVNTKNIHGRTPRSLEEITALAYQEDTDYTYQPTNNFSNWLISNMPLELPGDISQTQGNNTDFYTCGNPAWYAKTKYSIVLETYWARTQFLTEKTFKPIIAKHPFINMGNRSTELLRSFGFDTFDDVFGNEHDSMPAANKIKSVISKIGDIDIDPRRCDLNYAIGLDLLRQAQLEQKQLAQQVADLL